MISANEVMDRVYKEYKSKIGLFCLNCLIMRISFEDLNNFVEKNNIAINKNTKTKTGYMREIIVHFYNVFKNIKNIQDKHSNSIDLMGTLMLLDENINKYLPDFDFISKQELVDAFADYCADLKISVFSTADIPDYLIDLYLTKKTPRLRTEAVFIRIGTEMSNDNYKKTLDLIRKSSEIAIWTVFVTTPAGVSKIGLERIISDMESLNTWFYVVEPRHKQIYGITRGKTSKIFNESLSEAYLQKLPREPVRAPSQVITFSKYDFKESASYSPKKFRMYGIFSEHDMDDISQMPIEEPKYRDIFRNLIIIAKNSGISIFSYTSEIESLDHNLVSGFLVAMDQFVSEIGGSADMQEINYKGFFIQAGYGEEIKVALFLSESADQILKERLAYFIKRFEEKYEKEIESFEKTGDVSNFKEPTITRMVKEILDV